MKIEYVIREKNSGKYLRGAVWFAGIATWAQWTDDIEEARRYVYLPTTTLLQMKQEHKTFLAYDTSKQHYPPNVPKDLVFEGVPVKIQVELVDE